MLGSASFSVAAQSYPTKPIKLVVPSAPGGSTDQLARLMGDRLSAAWGQTVVIENKPGAGLTLGAAHVADAPADGYTLLMGAVHHSIAQSRSEERRVGKECVCTCSSRWEPAHTKKST